MVLQVPIPHQKIQEDHQKHIEHQIINDDSHNYLNNDYKIFHQHVEPEKYTDEDQSHLIYRYDPEAHELMNSADDINVAREPQFYIQNPHLQHKIFTPEIKYRYSHEITADDDDLAEDKNIIIEAREELMKILAKRHKTVERREIDRAKILRINNAASSPMTKKKKRSLLTWWTVSTESSGNNESFEDEDEVIDEDHLSLDDQWLVGCLIHCIYKKSGAIDRLEYPTLDGIVDLYTAGTSDQPFFMYALRAVNKCLKHVSIKHDVNRKKKPQKGVSCNIAFDVFECVTDSVADYCDRR